MSACDRGTPELSVVDSPSLRVVATSPADNALDVPVDAPIRVRFDRFLRPDTAVRQSIRVTGGTLDKATGAPIAGETYLEPTYDVVERVVTWRLPAGSQWTPGVRFTITLWKAGDHDGLGVRAWDGRELDASVVFAFTPGTTTSPPEVPIPSGYCGTCSPDRVYTKGARDILKDSCAFGACHLSSDLPPEMDLDLGTRAGLERTALRRPAHETFTGPSSTDAPTNPFVLGVNMPIIDPGNPGNSFLLFKALVRPENYATSNDSKAFETTPLGVGGEVLASAEERARLADGFVRGQPMPINADLDIHRLRTLQAWIAAGAPLEDDAACPKQSDCKPPDGPLPAFYLPDVKNILGARCGLPGCHIGSDTSPAQSGIDFTKSSKLFRGKVREKGGPEIIVVPGKPAESFLMNKLTGNITDPALACAAGGKDANGKLLYCGDPMPLIGAPLDADEIALVTRWIQEGAKESAADP